MTDSTQARTRLQSNASAGHWSLALFGGVSLSRRDRTVTLRNRKSQAILGYIALSPARRATREQLAGLLWSESSETLARASLRQALRGLRQVLESEGIGGIAVGRDDTSISPDGVVVDVWDAFDKLRHGEIAPLFMERKAVYETLLANLDEIDPAFHSWLLVQRQNLHERAVLALEARLAELGDAGLPAPGARQAEKEAALALLNLDPTHEGACRRLMLTSVAEGDMSGALRRYNTLWDILDRDYDVEPSDETQRLVAAIKTGTVAAPGRDMPPPLRSEAALPRTESGSGRETSGAHGQRRLRMLVGPFETTGVHLDQRYLVDGFRHQLISSLIRFREWSLIDGARVPVLPASLEQATYAISASSYQARSELQLVLTLSDVATGEYVWSEDVSADLATWFSTQKLVVRRLAIALNVHLSADRLDRTLGEPHVSLALYDRWLRGEALTARWRGRNRLEAADIFRSIIAEAPNFTPAYCSIVNFTNSRSHIFPGEMRTDAHKQEALDLALVAVQLDATYSRTHLCAAWSYALNGQFDQAALSFQMAYDLNENDPWTIVSSSLGLAFCGGKEMARERAELALALGLCVEPRHWGYQAVIRFLCGDYEGCIAAADQAQDVIYNFAAWKAAALTQLGQHDAARAEWRRFVALVSQDWHGDGPPNHAAITRWLLQGFPIKSQDDWERLRDGIPSAGVPVAVQAG